MILIIILSALLRPMMCVAASPVSENQGALIDDSPFPRLEELSKLRDPFKIPDSIEGVPGKLGDGLERYGLDSLKVVGILTGPERLRALIATPDGKTFSAGERAKIGQSGGVIKKIYEDRVVVQQKSKDVVGKIVWDEIELPLLAESSASPSDGMSR